MSITPATMTPVLVHGTVISYAGIGILITGPSGAGKSLLALEFMSGAGAYGPARLVADDQVSLGTKADQLWATAPAVLAGLIELRGRGIVKRAFLDTTRIDLNVVLSPDVARLPAEEEFGAQWLGIDLAAAPVGTRKTMDVAHQRLLVDEAVAQIVGLNEKIT